MENGTAQLIVNEHCQTGENPYWVEEEKAFYWVDIPRGKMFRWDSVTGRHTLIYQGKPVGGFTRQADGSFLLFRTNDVVVLQKDWSMTPLFSFSDPGAKRFNDVIADPAGRVFAGTIGQNKESGGLYRVSLTGKIECLFRGTGVANGMGFSPNLDFFYWICSTRRTVFKFCYHRETGHLTEQTIFHTVTQENVVPDGLTVDAEGGVWIALNKGSALLHLNQRGEIIETISVPVAKPLSVCFGGEDFRTLFVTTGGGQENSASLDGAVFTLKTPLRGRPEFVSQIGL